MILFSLVHIDKSQENFNPKLNDILRNLSILGEVWLTEFPSFDFGCGVWSLHLLAQPIMPKFREVEGETLFSYATGTESKKIWIGDFDCLVNLPKPWGKKLNSFRHYEFYDIQ